jgi:hypothetical protein
MPVQDAHQSFFRTSVALSHLQVKNVISPLEVIRTLNAAKVSFILVGAHGIAGWMKKPRATQDVDLVIAERHVKKATRALTSAFPNLEPSDLDVVVRFKDRDTGEVKIDLIKPRELYRQAFQYTHAVTEQEEPYRIPSVEMAVAMKFAAMVSPNRALEKKYQDAHDFIMIVKENSDLDGATLQTLGNFVYGGGGENLLEMIRRARAGEQFDL